jgi:hypothetical protein
MGVAAAGVILDACGGSLTGGTAGTNGAAGTGGWTGGAGTSGPAGTGGGAGFGQPACPAEITRGAACLPTDLQLCYKTCGPEKSGVKSDTCAPDGTYAEMSGCTFDPSRDYSCYSIPEVATTICPNEMPQASQTCDVPRCMPCNSSFGLPGGGYLDSGGAAKVGWCVCQAPNAAGVRTWSCANDVSWPCPLGAGCRPIFTGIGGVGGGSSGAAGAGGAGGSTGTGAAGAGGGFGQPACPSTVTKGGPCASVDTQFCYKTCGPESLGLKSETCTGGVYAEMSGCSFDPARDYSCYRIPAIANDACAAGGTPQANGPCTINACTLCNDNRGLPGGFYLDSAGAQKQGYCVCSTSASGAQKWSCAVETAWPCPAGSGC